MKRFTIKDIMQRTKSESWLGKNDIVPRTLKFSNHVVRGGMKTTGKGSPAAREPIVKQNKEHIRNCRSQYCKNNRERINEY